MKVKESYLIIVVVMFVYLVGCGEQYSNYTAINTKSQIDIMDNIIIDDFFQEEINLETSSKLENSEFVRVLNNDYSKAYAKALSKKWRIPHLREAHILMERYGELIQLEPRFVIDSNEKYHLMWTNNERYVVIDGEETEFKVSNCIFVDELPKLLEKLDELKEYHKSNDEIKFGIAETTFLDELWSKMEQKGFEVKGLWRVRFYNYNGKAVAVYSLTENGELYINENVASEILQ